MGQLLNTLGVLMVVLTCLCFYLLLVLLVVTLGFLTSLLWMFLIPFTHVFTTFFCSHMFVNQFIIIIKHC